MSAGLNHKLVEVGTIPSCPDILVLIIVFAERPRVPRSDSYWGRGCEPERNPILKRNGCPVHLGL